ncbi:MAG: hypothetical protein LC792_14940 [Actinobacteria bacterium]|nr:hypothetical protein [Actinomycetota bacterium]
MRKSIGMTAVILSVALFAACGGAKKNKASLLPSATTIKLETPPSGQTASVVGAPGPQPCGEVFDAAWVQTPKSVKEAVQMASTAVEAEVSAVAPGEDLVVPASLEPGGQYRIPTQKVTVKVTRTIKGSAAPGQTLNLFQTGSACRTLKGDPPYKQGEKHLLMLTEGPKAMLTTISPEGRFKQAADGTLEPTTDGPVADEVRGKKIADIEPSLREAASLPPITTPNVPKVPGR